MSNLPDSLPEEWHLVDESDALRGVKMTFEKAQEKLPEWFGSPYFHEAMRGSVRPDPTLLHAFKDAFGDEARLGMVDLVFCNFYKRWCVLQRADTNDGTGKQWKYAFVISTPPTGATADGLPPDLAALNADGRYDHMMGQVGAFKVPNVEDFVWLKQSYDLLERKERIGQMQARLQNQKITEAKKVFNDQRHDWWSHNLDKLKQASQRERGSWMSGLPFVPQTSLDELRKQSHEKAIAEGKLEVKDTEHGYQVHTHRTGDPITDKAIKDAAFRKDVAKVVNPAITPLEMDLLEKKWESPVEEARKTVDDYITHLSREAILSDEEIPQPRKERQLELVPVK
jgi:hypothetical protein